ncbi:alpha/beta hydrolase [Streptomyces hebeiensis]|uniref:Alpha/beta hydrolase n=1 Tax=Streptomyces hebeiensis TaxID=229486 RepID=A0ABN1V2C2_9ACTN
MKGPTSVLGERERDREPVVMLHALALDSSMWEAQRRALTERGHLVIAPDQRGFGGAPLGTDPPSLTVVADDLARALDGRGIDRAALVGASMGGYVLMEFLRRHPGRASAVALLSARAVADTAGERAERLRFAGAIGSAAREDTGPGRSNLTGPRRSSGKDLVARLVPLLVGATTRRDRPDVVARVLATALVADPAALAWAQRAVAERRDHTETLRSTRVPAVVIAGAEDELVPSARSRECADALPHGRLVTVADAGHLSPLENPGPVTEALCALLARTGAAAC